MVSMNQAGFALLQRWEGCVLHAYDDANDHPVNPGDPVYGTLTIGYGHTGSDVNPGLIWNQEEANAALQNDVVAVTGEIEPLIGAELNANQFSALVCLAFNIGPDSFAGSSALHLANAGDLVDVPAHIRLWDKMMVNGRLVASSGLANRRAAEVELWNMPPPSGDA